MVGVPGIEPGTSSLSGTRSNQLSYTPKSGGNRVRTGDPELAKLVLYQLSYAPRPVETRRYVPPILLNNLQKLTSIQKRCDLPAYYPV